MARAVGGGKGKSCQTMNTAAGPREHSWLDFDEDPNWNKNPDFIAQRVFLDSSRWKVDAHKYIHLECGYCGKSTWELRAPFDHKDVTIDLHPVRKPMQSWRDCLHTVCSECASLVLKKPFPDGGRRCPCPVRPVKDRSGTSVAYCDLPITVSDKELRDFASPTHGF